jgi:hypothetical protein
MDHYELELFLAGGKQFTQYLHLILLLKKIIKKLMLGVIIKMKYYLTVEMPYLAHQL